MLSRERVRLYELERIYIEGIEAGYIDLSLEKEMGDVRRVVCEDFDTKALRSIQSAVVLVTPIKFTTDFLRTAVNVDTSQLDENITETDFQAAKKYVEELVGVNLSRVKWKYLVNPLRENVEGFCVASGDDEHCVFVQNDANGAISRDLLIHELGHSAEFCISREEADDALIIGHPCLSEAFAYYCQGMYLKEHGSPVKRIGMFGAFLITYLSICMLRYCVEHEIKLSELDCGIAVRDEEFQAIVEAYPRGGEDFVINKMEELKVLHEELGVLIFNEISPRFGLILAVYIITMPHFCIKTMAKKNSISNDLIDIFNQIFPSYEEQVVDIEGRLLSFFSN